MFCKVAVLQIKGAQHTPFGLIDLCQQVTSTDPCRFIGDQEPVTEILNFCTDDSWPDWSLAGLRDAASVHQGSGIA